MLFEFALSVSFVIVLGVICVKNKRKWARNKKPNPNKIPSIF